MVQRIAACGWATPSTRGDALDHAILLRRKDLAASTPGTVVITGATGFIGAHLVRHFARTGWTVHALCRSAASQAPVKGVLFREFRLPDVIPEEDFRGARVLIHCAYAHYSASRPDADAINDAGTRRLLAIARSAGLQQVVYLSSLSARPDALSHYGRHKWAMEQLFDPARDLVIRPGLTIGDGGLVRSIARTIRTRRLVPLVGGGGQPVYTIGIDDLSAGLSDLITRGVTGRFSLAAGAPVTMRTLHTLIAEHSGTRCTFVPVPYPLMFGLLRLGEALGLSLPVTTEHLRGLRQLRSLDLRGDLAAMALAPRPLTDCLDLLPAA